MKTVWVSFLLIIEVNHEFTSKVSSMQYVHGPSYQNQFLYGIYKPIFNGDTKTLVLGRRVWQYPQRESIALGIPKCWYLKMLKFALPQI